MERRSLHVVVFGATSSIGQQLIRLYASRGARLALVARHAEHLATVASDARSRGAGSVQTWLADLDVVSGLGRLVEDVSRELKGFDVAVLAQGVLPDQASCERYPEVAAGAMHANFTAPAALVLELVKSARSGERAIIAVLCSVAGDRGRQSNYVYGGAKGGLAIFLEGLRHRLRGSQTSIVTIKPGTVRGRMTDGLQRLPLPSEAATVAAVIERAISRRRAVVYAPWFWAPIMGVIRRLPRAVFERTKL